MLQLCLSPPTFLQGNYSLSATWCCPVSSVRSRWLAPERFGAAIETVGVNRAVLGGSHAVMLLHQPEGHPGEDGTGNGGDLGLPHMFSHILDFYASCEHGLDGPGELRVQIALLTPKRASLERQR